MSLKDKAKRPYNAILDDIRDLISNCGLDSGTEHTINDLFIELEGSIIDHGIEQKREGYSDAFFDKLDEKTGYYEKYRDG